MGLNTVPTAAELADYTRAGILLLPPGLAWQPLVGSDLRKLFEGFAGAWARLGIRVADLLLENDPTTAVETLEDWERVLGLPAPCAALSATIARRRAAVVAKLLAKRGPSIGAIKALASDLGWESLSIEIVEEQAFRAGVSTAGDVVQGEDWGHVWRVIAPTVNPIFATCASSTCTDTLVDVDNDPLECFLELVKPAHTVLLVEFSATYTGHAPWTNLTPTPAQLALGSASPALA